MYVLQKNIMWGKKVGILFAVFFIILLFSLSFYKTEGKESSQVIDVVSPALSNIKIPQSDTAVLDVVADMPLFVGGLDAMKAYIKTNLKYPPAAMNQAIKGIVFVKFVVEKDGKLSQIHVLRGIHPLCDQEALRIIKSMPPWRPGKESGVPQRVWQTVSVMFDPAKL